MKEERKLQITWLKSGIGYRESHKATLRALGFRRLGETLEKPDSPAIRGMLAKVGHLVKWEMV
ncbi:MAG: 50S ribosomal protein L30 [Chloroflexi bacterium]|nr:50S ribosomal protein L30 [Chloroflexota bacterium]